MRTELTVTKRRCLASCYEIILRNPLCLVSLRKWPSLLYITDKQWNFMCKTSSYRR